jgi:FMN phosphatase YigB (HAD superfamily)
VTAILSDGDVVFQPHKIRRSGLQALVDDHVLIYVHKEQELPDIETRYPAEHYVMVDDKLRILTELKRSWGKRVTTVFVKQGHYATDPAIVRGYPAADVELNSIGEFGL